ncbi:MAG TPA: ATP-binding protein [Hyphomicrobiaceae bacterium]|nr:ATP-binding protein [Hyphomicrobiaceae bacterium]
MRFNSLAFRLFAAASVWTFLVLPVAGFAIYSLYRQDVSESFDDRIRTLLTVILADSVERAGFEPGMPGDLGEPLFQLTNSGWYWQIRPTGGAQGRRLASPSLANASLPSPYESQVEPDDQGTRWMSSRGPANEPVRIAEMVYVLGDEATGPRYSFTVAGPLEWLDERIAVFRTRLAIALALAGAALLAVTFLQVRYGLLPLRAIERRLAAIRSGEATSLEGELPVEIEPLQHELNALIKSNQDIIDRARTQVGNLAHALKTPLAVIINEANEDKSPFARKVAEQASLMRDQVSYYLDRARMAARAGTIGRVSEVRPIAEGLQRTLERIYGDKGIRVLLDCPAGVRFQGERQDLEEMLGNVLDNACKWARTKVYFRAATRPATTRGGRVRLIVTVDDDGPGLTEQERARIGKRGQRLDETKPGTGLGLSIVNDLVHSYGGRIEFSASRHGGLNVRLDLPAA